MPSDYEALLIQGLMSTSLKITREARDTESNRRDGFSIVGSYGGTKLTYADRVHDMPTRERGGIERSVVGIYSGDVDYSKLSAAAAVLHK